MGKSMFVAIEGVDGVGKSTAIKALFDANVVKLHPSLVMSVYVDPDPDLRNIIDIARNAPPIIQAAAFAVQRYAWTRMIEYTRESESQHAADYLMLSDRYMLSSLVYQALNMLNRDYDDAMRLVWELNEDVPQPELTIVLNADVNWVWRNLQARGLSEDDPNTERDVEYLMTAYNAAVEFLRGQHPYVLSARQQSHITRINVTSMRPDEVAEAILWQIAEHAPAGMRIRQQNGEA